METVPAEYAADLAPAYRRRDLRANGVLRLRGLLMPGVAGNCWSIAEAAGLDRPYGLHHLLERACRVIGDHQRTSGAAALNNS